MLCNDKTLFFFKAVWCEVFQDRSEMEQNAEKTVTVF